MEKLQREIEDIFKSHPEVQENSKVIRFLKIDRRLNFMTLIELVQPQLAIKLLKEIDEFVENQTAPSVCIKLMNMNM